MDDNQNNWLAYMALTAAIVAGIALLVVPLAAIFLGITGIVLAWRASYLNERGTVNRSVVNIALILSILVVIFAGTISSGQVAHVEYKNTSGSGVVNR